MSDFQFVPATKEQAKARVALSGPSGSGKTWTGLILASGLAGPDGRIAVIDTERGSASKYVGPFKFDRLNMYRYDPRDLVKALGAAGKAGYDVVLVDSLSRFWSGAGGMLEVVDNAARRSYGGNSFGGWKEARPIENDMIEAMLGYPGHVIVTMRVKTAYEVTEDERGRKAPTKIGLQPEQRNGIEYEFDVVGDMDLENTLTVSKSRCPELSGRVINRPDHEMAETLLAWLTDGEPARSPNDYRDIAVNPATTRAELQDLYRRVKEDGKLGANVMDETGETVTLHALITRRGSEARAAEEQEASTRSPVTPQQPSGSTDDGPVERDYVPPDVEAGEVERRFGAEPGTSQEQAGDNADGQPADTGEQQWVLAFMERLADSRASNDFTARRGEIARAVASHDITPETANDLSTEVTRAKTERKANAA